MGPSATGDTSPPERRWVASQSLVVQPVGYGRFAVTGSISTGSLGELDGATLLLASSFTEPGTLDDAQARLGEDVGATREETADAIETLVSMGVLRELEAGERPPPWDDYEGFSDPLVQLRMVADEPRVIAYRDAIRRHVPGATVLDVGTGTGIMALFASQAGARRVHAVEETSMARVAREVIRRNGACDRVEVIQANSMDLELVEPVDVIIHELFGVEPFDENLLPFLQDARRRWLRPGGRMLPQRLEVAVVGVEGIEALDPRGPPSSKLDDLGQRYGVDLSPLAEALATRAGVTTTPHVRLTPDRAITDEAVLFDIHFDSDIAAQTESDEGRSLVVTRAGRLDALVVVRRFHVDEETVISTSPFDPATHWGCAIQHLARPKPVQVGDRIELRAELRTISGREGLALRVVD